MQHSPLTVLRLALLWAAVIAADYAWSRGWGFDRPVGTLVAAFVVAYGYVVGLRMKESKLLSALSNVATMSFACWCGAVASAALVPWSEKSLDSAMLAFVVLPGGCLGLSFAAFARRRFASRIGIVLWTAAWVLLSTGHSAWQAYTGHRAAPTHLFLGSFPLWADTDSFVISKLASPMVRLRCYALLVAFALLVECTGSRPPAAWARSLRCSTRILAIVGTALAVVFFDESGLGNGRRRLQRVLAAEEHGASCVVRYEPGSHDVLAVQRVADDCDWAWSRLRELGPPFSGEIDGAQPVLWLYRDAEQLRRLTGRAEGVFAAPSRWEIHTFPTGGGRVRALDHELAHLYTYAGRGRAKGSARGSPWREGIAEALASGYHSGSSMHGAVARLLEGDCLPSTEERMQQGALFWPWKRLSPLQYQINGSFCGYLLNEYGWAAARTFAGDGSVDLAYGRSWTELDAEWRHYLAAVEPAPWTEQPFISCDFKLLSANDAPRSIRRTIVKADAEEDWPTVIALGSPFVRGAGRETNWLILRMHAAFTRLGRHAEALEWLSGLDPADSAPLIRSLQFNSAIRAERLEAAGEFAAWLARQPFADPSESLFRQALVRSAARALGARSMGAGSVEDVLEAARAAVAADPALCLVEYRAIRRFRSDVKPDEARRLLGEFVSASCEGYEREKGRALQMLAALDEEAGNLSSAVAFVDRALALELTGSDRYEMKYERGRLQYRLQRGAMNTHLTPSDRGPSFPP